jgi:hypothetical protein
MQAIGYADAVERLRCARGCNLVLLQAAARGCLF